MKSRGFTLLELMVVVAIVGILAAIAYPNYRDSVRKANRSDGMTALTQIQLAQEKLRASCRFYGRTIAASNSCAAVGTTTVKYTTGTNNSPEGWYTVTITASDGVSFTAQAVAAKGDQDQDKEGSQSCATLTLAVSATDPTGLKTPAECW